MQLRCVQHIGSKKTYHLNIEHPVAGKPHWEIIEHRSGYDGSKSVRPLAEITPATDGHSAVVHALAWPGVVEIEVSADAMLPTPSAAMPRTMKIRSTIVIQIPEIPDLVEGLDLRVVPEGVHDFPASK